MGRERSVGDLQSRSWRATLWQFLSVVVRAVLQIAVLAVLSRLLPPTEFGTLGVAMIVVGFAALFVDVGIGAAIVQLPDLGEHHVRVAFTLSVITGFLVTGITWLIAPAGASFFNNEAVEPVLRLLSWTFSISGFGVVSRALLKRRLHFGAITTVDIISYAIGYGGVGTVLALRGAGVFALAWAVLTQAVLRSVLQLVISRHSVVPSVRWNEASQILNYGVGMSLTRLFNYAASRGDYLVVGRWLGAQALGLYERAYRLMELPADYFAGVLNAVAFPAMSEVHADSPRLRRIYLNLIGVVSLVYLPMSVVLFVVAEPLVVLLFGDQWRGAAQPFQIMSVGLVFRASYKISDSLIRATAAVYRSAWRVAFYAIAVFLGAYVALDWGIRGVAIAIVIAIIFKYLIVAQLCLKLLDSDWRTFLRFQRTGLFLGSILVAVLTGTVQILGRLGVQDWTVLLAVMIVGAASVLLAIRLFPSQLGQEFHWALNLIERQTSLELVRVRRWTGSERRGQCER